MATTGPGEQMFERPLPVWVRIADSLSRYAGIVPAILLLVLAVNVVIDVLGRYLFIKPLEGTFEWSMYWWLPGVVLLGYAVTELRQEHIKVALLLDAMPLRLRQIVEGTVSALAAVLIGILIFYAFKDAVTSQEIGLATSGKVAYPIWPLKYVAVFGATLLLLQSLASSYRFFTGRLPQKDTMFTEADVS